MAKEEKQKLSKEERKQAKLDAKQEKADTKMGGKTQTIYGLTGLRRFDCNVFK